MFNLFRRQSENGFIYTQWALAVMTVGTLAYGLVFLLMYLIFPLLERSTDFSLMVHSMGWAIAVYYISNLWFISRPLHVSTYVPSDSWLYRIFGRGTYLLLAIIYTFAMGSFIPTAFMLTVTFVVGLIFAKPINRFSYGENGVPGSSRNWVTVKNRISIKQGGDDE